MQSLIDVQNSAFMAIGPCRIASLSLLALTQETQDKNAQAASTLSITRIKTAHTMLSTDLKAMLDDCGYCLPDELETKRKACLKALSPLHKAVNQPEQDALVQISQIPALSAHCLYELEPVISDFLKDLVQTLRDQQQQREQEKREGMRVTIANAEDVGRNIKFISFNASIEAARIGEMGKGFAVIATEIRALSGKTQNLLEEISAYLKH